MFNMKAVTMINPATGWFEIVQHSDKRSITIANLVEQTWLCRYSWTMLITYDRGSEFIGFEFHNMVKTDYGIKCKPITAKSTSKCNSGMLDENDPWGGILSAKSLRCMLYIRGGKLVLKVKYFYCFLHIFVKKLHL